MHAISRTIVRMLVAARWPLLAAAIVLAVVAYPFARDLSFNRSIETMFPADGELVTQYRQLKETFGGNEIVIAAYEDEKLLAPDGSGIRRLEALRRQVAAVPGVRAVLSLGQILGDDGERIVDDEHSTAPQLRELFSGYTHSRDGTVAALVCMLEPPESSPVSRHQSISAIGEIIEPLPAGVVAGEPVMVSEGFQMVEQDGKRLAWWSTALLAITILVCLHSLRWMLIPIAVVQWTLLLTRASLVWANVRLSMVSSMLTAIVTVVGVATVIHVAVRFRQARILGRPARNALIDAGALLAAPIFWSCATDAVGFGSLLAARVGPIQDFGVMMAVGAVFVLFGTALIVPALALAANRDLPLDDEPARGGLDHGLAGSVRFVDRNRWWLSAVGLLLFASAAWGMTKLEIETDFTKNFRDGSRIVRAYGFVETRLGGAGVFDVVLPAPERLDWSYLQQVQRLENRLRSEVLVRDVQGHEEAGLTKVLSLSDAVAAGSPINISNLPLQFIRDRTARKGIDLMRERIPAFVDALYSPGSGERPPQLRIMLRAKERQPAEEKLRLIQQVETIIADELGKPEWKSLTESTAADAPIDDTPESAHGIVTGYFVLLTNLIASILEDQWLCFGLATLGVAIMMTLAFRSPRLALIALVPNALPIMVVLGGMGWLGFKMNMGAAMIAAVSMGLSVDSSIHYITTFRRARHAGQTVHEAVNETQQTVGRAVVLATLALIVGFAVLVSSDFIPTVYFGVLVSLSMLGGLFGNLLILPMLLLMIAPARQRAVASSAAN